MIRTALTLLTASLTVSAGAATLRFDFGSIDDQTADLGWNNVTYPTGANAPALTSIVDSTGSAVTGLSLVVVDPFYTATQPEPNLGTSSPTGDAAASPASATRDFFLGHTGTLNGGGPNPTGGFKLTGLDQNLTYDFTFFASRIGVFDNRETAYNITGGNSAQGLLQASGNTGNVLTLAGITPDANNEIYIEVSAGPNNNSTRSYYYINTLHVDYIPEPSSLALLALGGLLMVRRRRD